MSVITVPLFFVAELQESNVRLKLTIVDSVGFGDQINKEDRYVKKLYDLSLHNWERKLLQKL